MKNMGPRAWDIFHTESTEVTEKKFLYKKYSDPLAVFLKGQN
jgi:hypothetical protein